MKRLTVLTVAAWVWGSSAGLAADPLPAPTGFAPIAPRTPLPLVRGGTVVPAAATDVPAAGAVQMVGFSGLSKALTGGGARGPQVWCTDCAPVVPQSLPPAPVGAAAFAVKGCADGACAPDRTPVLAGHDGSCLSRIKDWMCFRYTPNRLGFVPTPRFTPFYTYFPCAEKAGVGCASGNCGPGGCGTGPAARVFGGAGAVTSVAAGRACKTCPQPGEAVMPGYRLATPTPTTATPTPVSVPDGDVLQSGFRAPPGPSPVVQYRPGAWTPTAMPGR